MAFVDPHPAHSCQNCCILYPKYAKNEHETREYAPFLPSKSVEWLYKLYQIFFRFQSVLTLDGVGASEPFLFMPALLHFVSQKCQK